MASTGRSPQFLSALILAGGYSSRMGQDKALLPIDGKPMLRRVYDAAIQCTDQVWVVTPWCDRYQPLLPDSCGWVWEQAWPEDDDSLDIPHGPLIGCIQGMQTVESEWVLVLACDLPNLQGATLQDWSAQLAPLDDSIVAALPHSTHHWESLCGFYRRSALPLLMEFASGGGRSFQRWLATQSVHCLAVSDPKMLLNCNTPRDLKKV